jgi:integrase
VYGHFLAAARAREAGARMAWALNTMRALCRVLGTPDDPEALPADAVTLLRGMHEVTRDWTAQMQQKSVVYLRAMLAAAPSMGDVLRAFPLRLRTVVDPVQRQSQLVKEDIIPRRLRNTWVGELLDKVLQHPASAGWRTSRCARQMLSMVHHLLRRLNLLEVTTLADFEQNLLNLEPATLQRMCNEFCEVHCVGSQSVKRYTRIQNLVFHHVWSRLPQAIKPTAHRRRVRTLEEIDAALSDSSGGGGGSRGSGDGERDVAFLTVKQSEDLLAACGDCLRSRLMIQLLLTTGLRRQGLVNIRIMDVAHWDEETRHWVIDKAGQTLEKGRRTRTFPLYPEVQGLLDRWLNGTGAGVRPPSPSRYLFPSAITNNGQMSTETLRAVFRAACRAANLPRRLSHLHVTRHTCAHRLLEAGNTSRQIAAYIGHRSSATTERFYLRDSPENITRGMTTPQTWTTSDTVVAGAAAAAGPVAPARKRQRASPSIDMLRQVIELRMERNRALAECNQTVKA